MASLFALLLVAAHGVTLLLDRGRSHLRPWRAAVAAAVAVLSPLIFLGYRQDQALGWVTRPGVGTLAALVSDFAGSRQLITLVIATAVCGVVSGRASSSRSAGGPGPNGPEAGRGPEVTVVTVALPWLVLPPFTLLAVSLVRPVYVERYVVFGQPRRPAVRRWGGLAGRSAGIRRLWLVQWADQMSVPPGSEMGREKLALARSMRLIRRWTVQSVVLSLYAAGQP